MIERSYYPKKRCRWCSREYDEVPPPGTPGRNLCPRCRKKHLGGGKPGKADAMFRRVPGHYGAKEGG